MAAASSFGIGPWPASSAEMYNENGTKVEFNTEIGFRFASLAGGDPATSKNEGDDPSFYGATGYNAWFMSEIAANYAGFFGINAEVDSIGLRTSPSVDIGVGKWTGLSGYISRYSVREDAPSQYSSWGAESAAYGEFSLFDNLNFAPIYSILLPEQDYKDVFGADKTAKTSS